MEQPSSLLTNGASATYDPPCSNITDKRPDPRAPINSMMFKKSFILGLDHRRLQNGRNTIQSNRTLRLSLWIETYIERHTAAVSECSRRSAFRQKRAWAKRLKRNARQNNKRHGQ
jgi:hypothetical protein